MNKVNKKKLGIIIVICAVVIVIVGGGIAYAIWQGAKKDSGNSAANEPSQTAQSFGACSIISESVIKDTFGGEEITSVSKPTQRNEKASNETTADVCEYTFSTKYSADNHFTVSVYPYAADESDAVSGEWSEVGGSTPVAYFNAATNEAEKRSNYSYRILPGSTNVVMTLSQPLSAQTYNQDQAFDFVGGIAAKANLAAITEATETENTNLEPGGISEDL